MLPTKKGFKVVCEPSSFGAVRDALSEGGFTLDEELSRLSMAPNAVIEVRGNCVSEPDRRDSRSPHGLSGGGECA